ncbi:hypothetical protein PATSB16_37900 [Pandoraea thiooxydans]|nr:hypothetical protein PATSB16_37900 [Pandoraea thiooxydans]
MPDSGREGVGGGRTAEAEPQPSSGRGRFTRSTARPTLPH